MARHRFSAALRLLAGLACSLALVPAWAFDMSMASMYDHAKDKLIQIWDEGGNELYLPLDTFHLRFAYSQEKIKSFNEAPRGLGYGRGLYEPGGDWHGVYAMAFTDSHYKPEYMFGYCYKMFWPNGRDLRVGIGYTAFLTGRTDYAHYFPIPGILPMVSLQYRKFSIDSTYVPGGQGYGNVIFTNLKIPF